MYTVPNAFSTSGLEEEWSGKGCLARPLSLQRDKQGMHSATSLSYTKESNTTLYSQNSQPSQQKAFKENEYNQNIYL